MLIRFALFWLVPCVLCQMASASVVINEVFYHAPDDVEDLEWIELHNTSAEPVDVSEWSLATGVEFKFPAGTVIQPGGFLVICKNVELFREYYDVPAVGGFARSLSNNGETIELLDGSSEIVDAVTYLDRAPWAVSADGYGASLERINPAGHSNEFENWASSSLPLDGRLPSGTPGKPNDSFSANSPPRITDVSISPTAPAPGVPLALRCTVTDTDGVNEVHALFRSISAGQASDEQRVMMSPEADGEYRTVLPGQQAGVLVRLRIQAVDNSGTVALYPHVNALRPAMSVYMMEPPPASTIPLAFVISSDAEMAATAQRVWNGSGQGMQASMMRANVKVTVDSEFDLGTPWYQLTVSQTPSHGVYLRLRDLFNGQKAKRQAIVDEVLAAENLPAEMQALSGRAKQFNAELTTEIKAVLPAEDAKKYRPTGKSFLSGPSDYLKQMLKLEQLWLALATEFQCTDQQLQTIREALKNIHQERRQLLSLLAQLMTRRAGFEELQVKLGGVEQQMWKDLKPVLSLRQYRFARQWYRDQGSIMGFAISAAAVTPARGSSAFVRVDPRTQKAQVFDFINILPRSAGYKVRFHKDRPLDQRTTINVIYEVNERFVLAEPLAFDLYRRVGSPACLTEFVRLQVDQNVVGYYLVCEQPNRAFLRRNDLDDDGNLYKLIWHGNGIEGQHEKKTHPDDGHDDLFEVIGELEQATDESRWGIIQRRFDVEQLINYFAVNMCLSHWDGFFNNFFAYHDTNKTGKWQMFPWDQDKTWGFHDGTGDDEVFTDLPLTYGMEGDVPPGGGKPEMFAMGWWRPGGYFSKPLLANPEFRKRFLLRLHTILHDIYTEEAFFPIIDELAARLRPEVPLRAQSLGQDPDQAMVRFERNVGLLKEHLTKRRTFLLEQDELIAIKP